MPIIVLPAPFAGAVPPPAPPVRHVWAGALAVGCGNTVLTALLGSCVGIGIIWRRKKRCVLAHCLLADAPYDNPAEPGAEARYVSDAIPAMLRSLGAREEDYRELEVVAAGGASLFTGVPFPLKVGERNIAALERTVRALGLRVVHQLLGGSEGCRITLNCASLTYDTRHIGTV